MKNTSSSWLLQNPLFLVESYLKGLVHLGSSCRSWTTLLLPCETRVNRLNMFIILNTDYNIYTDYIHRYLVEVCLYWPIGQDTRCPYMTGGTHYMIGVTNSPQFLFSFFFQFLPVFFFQFPDLPLLFLPTSLICCVGFDSKIPSLNFSFGFNSFALIHNLFWSIVC